MSVIGDKCRSAGRLAIARTSPSPPTQPRTAPANRGGRTPAFSATDTRFDGVIAHAGGDADVQLGFSSATATQAVERAAAHVGAPIELTVLILEALRWCR